MGANPTSLIPARPSGRRVREFMRIARRTAQSTSDPKVMAMVRARSSKPRSRLARLLHVIRHAAG
ncbi:MAG: hypothetical protein AAGC57_21400 [Pseudomonadota bacterium]